jgi:predicted ATPase/DNA-binding CsgD family transcriptional regulator
VGGVAASAGAADAHGFTTTLTSFVGRVAEARELSALLANYRLVTVTGPGGVGKTRLASEVAQRMAGRFADGAWLAELATVADPAQVAAAILTTFGPLEDHDMAPERQLVRVMARGQLLLVLDNCEHVLPAVARLCRDLLAAADDVSILATSREPVGIPGEIRYRLEPLRLPGAGEQLDHAESDAMALFAERARRADRRFALDERSRPVVERIVGRLDGMPLAIELAAARVEALGVDQLADRLDGQLQVLTSADRLAPARQRSLAATAEWSYRLLSGAERRVFRRLAVFPASFSLDAAEAVAGGDALAAVLRLVDCSLLAPPLSGPDGRARYLMLQTLRAYGLQQLAAAGEEREAAVGLARYAAAVAEQAVTELETSGTEPAGARWLAAEDVTVHQALRWALEHEPGIALRLAIALAPWWFRQGRSSAGYELLGPAARHAAAGGELWSAAQFWCGVLSPDPFQRAGLDRFSAVRDTLAARGPSALLVRTLNERAHCLAHLRRYSEAVRDAEDALAMAADLAWPAGRAISLTSLAVLAHYNGDNAASLAYLRSAQRIDPATIPDGVARAARVYLARALTEAGELAEARDLGIQALDSAKTAEAPFDVAECLALVATLELRTGHTAAAAHHIRDALATAWRIDSRYRVFESIDLCGHLCVQAGRYAQAVTLWEARARHWREFRLADLPLENARRQELLREARRALGVDEACAAAERGAAMTLGTAVEYARLTAELTGPAAGLPQLSARERELVTLVADGRTDAQIASQLHISIRTVRSHLDRIRAKTGCRRRADLTRLALQIEVV